MIDVLSLAEQDTSLRRKAINEWSGPCPDPNCRCQNDGFSVKWNGEQYVFMCRGCYDSGDFIPARDRKRGWGDAIDYLRHYRGLSFQDAKALVQGDGGDSSDLHARPAQENWETGSWQDRMNKKILESALALWRGPGVAALAYARERGLWDETIRDFHLGYDSEHGTRRLTFPSVNENLVVAIYRRDLPPGKEWVDEPGGTHSELYMADCLSRRELPVVLVEDAFSALTIWQECKELVNVVGTGGATSGQKVKWIARLARMPLVLVALDADASGDENARWWLERLPNARRARPLLKDPNDMLLDGWDIRAWVQSVLSPPLSVIARAREPELDVARLRRGIGEMVRAEEDQWILSDELDPRWPASFKVRKRLRRKEASLWESQASEKEQTP